MKDEPNPWLVWCLEHGTPNYRHTNSVSAVNEASRMAKLNPGKRFFVMMAVGEARVEPEPSVYKAFCDDGVPF